MKKVVIVEALSTGFNYIQDCLDRDLEPIVLEVRLDQNEALETIQKERDEKYGTLKNSVKIIKEASSYEDTFKQIQALKPSIVIPGSEDGVILATRLADDLGLPGNSYSMIDKMTNKFYTHNALRDAGVRHIRGKICRTLQEAEMFFDELGNESVVVKPPHGAGSMGVRFCKGKADFLKKFAEQLGKVGCLGDVAQELLVQERIFGTEYIVNTMTFNGFHKVSSIWRYQKKAQDNGSNVYVGMNAIDDVTPEAYSLVEYAFQVLNAIGIKQGPVHGEFMIDEKGPVLIETNCRCMGGSYPAKYGDKVFGHHETDLALDSYINPDAFNKRISQPYKTNRFGFIKFMITPRNMPITNSPILGILPYLKSFFNCAILSTATSDHLDRTVDLETITGIIRLIHDNYSIIKQEYELLETLESKYFGLLYQETYDPSLGSLPPVSTEQESLDSFEINLRHLKDYPLEDVYHYLKQVIHSVKKGGTISVTKEAYEEFPYGASGMVMILKIFGLTVQLPTYKRDKIIATL